MTVYLASNTQLFTASSKFKFSYLPYKCPSSRDVTGLILLPTLQLSSPDNNMFHLDFQKVDFSSLVMDSLYF